MILDKLKRIFARKIVIRSPSNKHVFPVEIDPTKQYIIFFAEGRININDLCNTKMDNVKIVRCRW